MALFNLNFASFNTPPPPPPTPAQVPGGLWWYLILGQNCPLSRPRGSRGTALGNVPTIWTLSFLCSGRVLFRQPSNRRRGGNQRASCTCCPSPIQPHTIPASSGASPLQKRPAAGMRVLPVGQSPYRLDQRPPASDAVDALGRWLLFAPFHLSQQAGSIARCRGNMANFKRRASGSGVCCHQAYCQAWHATGHASVPSDAKLLLSSSNHVLAFQTPGSGWPEGAPPVLDLQAHSVSSSQHKVGFTRQGVGPF